MRAYYLAWACVLPIACSNNNSDALDPAEKLTSLTVGQAVQLCVQLVDEYPRKTVSCPNGSATVGLQAADCVSGSAGSNALLNLPASCTATIGDAESCAAAEYGDPCGSNSLADAAACSAFLSCVPSGSGI